MATQKQDHQAPSAEQVQVAVDMLKLMADPTRLRILQALCNGELSVNELALHVGAQPAAVSQHLAKLRLAKVVRTRRDGTRVFYETQDAHVRQLVEEALYHADHIIAGHADHGATLRGGAMRQ
jgi:DNA-binding transcriptional ArsR family regulator